MDKSGVMKKVVTLLVIFSILIVGTLGIFTIANYDDLNKLVTAVSLVKIYSVTDDLTISDMLDGAIKGVIDSLDDPYSSYMEREDYEEIQDRVHGTYGGVGLLIGLNEQGDLVVVSPFRGSPAHNAGIITGDIITAVNGQSTADMDLETAASLMQGDPGTEVKVTVFREGRGEEEYTITREMIEIPSVEGMIIEEYPRVGYINISNFNENTSRELSNTISELSEAGMEYMVLDLRNNPGGALQASVEAADIFLDSGPIVHLETKSESTIYEANAGKVEMPIVVLINEGSASASEILAGAIQDSEAGTLIGQRTFGKGVVQSVFELRDGSAVKLTTAKYYTPNKRDIHEEGIEPDILVEMTSIEVAEALMNAPDLENDLQLLRALEILTENMAN